MKLKTYRAKTMADALAEVKRDLGSDAVILHTRTTKAGGVLGIGARPVVEIIASDDASVARPRARVRGQAGSGASERAEPAPATATASVASSAARAYQRAAATAASSPAPAAVSEAMPVRAPVSSLAVPTGLAPVSAGAAAALEEELGAIKRMVGQVLRTTGTGAMSGGTGVVPEALFDQYMRLLESEVARDLADTIVGAVRDELTREELAEPEIVRQTILRHVAGHIPVAGQAMCPARPADSRPITIALVGPTGVGKTTTVAKLAAAYKLRHGKRVGLVTSDTYRIAAVDQLRTYANIIGLPLKVVLTPAEMGGACASLAGCDVVLIDTAGRSQHNTDRIEELREFLSEADPHETHLVLSSTASERVMLETARQFRAVDPTHVIFTKLDEAVTFGVLFNVLRSVGARLSFVTTGQEVPDHLEAGHPERLARLILDGELKGAAR